MDVDMRSKSKAWINEFLFVRGVIARPDASPRYRYHVTDEEYSELPTILRHSKPELPLTVYFKKIAAWMINERTQLWLTKRAN